MKLKQTFKIWIDLESYLLITSEGGRQLKHSLKLKEDFLEMKMMFKKLHVILRESTGKNLSLFKISF